MSVAKILTVASCEFGTAVKSKAFVIGIVMLPIFMGGAIAVEKFSQKHADVSDRRFVVVDGTGVLYDDLARAAEGRNAHLYEPEEGRQSEPKFVPVKAESRPGETPTDYGLRLSDEIKAGSLYAFVEIPADVLVAPGMPRVKYHSNTPTYRDLAQWIERSLNEAVRARVIKEEGLADSLVRRLDRKLDVASLGLVERAVGGGEAKAAEVNPIRTFVVPMVVLFLIFMTVMSAAPPLLSAVLEEKQLRISEFLVSAVTAFELMAGKLLGAVGVAALLAALYMGAAIGVAGYYGMIEQLPLGLVPWFFGFLVLATLIYGSIFISIGAACTDMKDAQSMMSPAMLLVMAPMFVWMVVLKEPTGSLATGFTLFPLFTPVLMPLRLSIAPTPPWWQAPASFLATLALTAFFVFAAGKIFRVGVLMQGKGASFRDMWRWVRAK
jgi:ABC-2 type transport system permease protein